MVTRILADAKIGGFATSTPVDVRGPQEMFVRLVKFFDNCGACGVTRIASNYGKSGVHTSASPAQTFTATAFDYWDTAANAGGNAWAVYRFGSATVPFYMLIQWAVYTTTNFNFGDSPGNPGSHNDTSYGGVGIQFAMRQDGTSPWAGTTVNTGSDTKGATVWTPGSSNIFVWPRSCSPGGTGNTTRAHTLSLWRGSWNDGGGYVLVRLSVVVDENNVTIISDYQGKCIPIYVHFGKYTALPGITTPVPYFCIYDSYLPILQMGTSWTYGPTTNNVTVTSIDGGIANPTPVVSGTVVGMFIEAPFLSSNSSTNWNTATLSGSAAPLAEYPILLFTAEGSNVGLAGVSDTFFRSMFGQYHGETLNNKTRLVFGRSAEGAAGNKIQCATIPWSINAPPPRTQNTRDGVEFTA